MFWLAKAKRKYKCDICGSIIRKGEKRLVYGHKGLCYTLIKRNVCLKCLEKVAPDNSIQSLKKRLKIDDLYEKEAKE